jgi:XRE family transcriptional regulator, regulator of sulfur utilization
MNLSALRRQAGLTQEELADECGLTVRTIQRIESGATIPRAYTLRKLAEVLNVSIDTLRKIPVEEIPVANIPVNSIPPDNNSTADLRWLNLSCFSYLVVPYVHFLIPLSIWKKNRTPEGRQIIDRQIYWLIALHGILLLTVAYNLTVVHYFKWREGVISYVLVIALLYALNAVIILRDHFRIAPTTST